jgi:hypothetical protein
MPLQATSGAASYDAFGGGVPVVPAYIEEVFSTWLYTGTGATQTITNGIDLSTKGGMIWSKTRSGSTPPTIVDTVRGRNSYLKTDQTSAAVASNGPTYDLVSFNSNGYTLGPNWEMYANNNGSSECGWTFRKQPKFFDIQTWTGTGANRTISHSLGSVPACIMVKRTDTTGAWQVYHSSLANTEYLVLNTTAAKATGATRWNSTTPTSSVFSVGTDATVNASGGTYVAYLFAHDAGGFGLTGTDNVISCGSYTNNSSSLGGQINLGYEPQWLMAKQANGADNWYIFDTMRGWSQTQNTTLNPNVSDAENAGTPGITPNATGFYDLNFFAANATIIYIAIRRGPMKVPTTGTSVFGLSARTGTGADATVTGGQTDDAVLVKNRGAAVASLFASRLTGTGYHVTSSTAIEEAAGTDILQANPWDVMDGVKVGTTSTQTNASSNTFINYLFKRSPSFCDVLCYTGTGTVRTVTHNLGVIPELMIIKRRTVTSNWSVYSSALGNASIVFLNLTDASASDTISWSSTTPTSTQFTLGNNAPVNASGGLYVAYLFATCPAVSKVFSYTGNGSSQTINCGFTSGARFVMIKRTDSTGDWYVWDTARGIVAGNDPYVRLNSTAAEVTTNDTIDTDSTGFVVNQVAATGVNVSSATYIGLAIA